MSIRPPHRPTLPRSIRPTPLILASALAVAIAAGSLGTLPAAASDRVVVVQAGQTLSEIAAAHGTTVDRLVALNDIADPNRIYAGQRLRVRGASPSAAKPVHRAPLVLHRIAYGETLTGIATRYATTIRALVIRNHLADASRIYAGQLLRISGAHHQARRAHGGSRPPGGSPRPAHHASAVIHVVRAGETLSGIAIRYRVTVDAVAAANRLANPSFIRTGQQLRIPGAQRSRPAQPGHHAPAPGVGMPPSMAAIVQQRRGMRQLIVQEARRQHFPPALALAVGWQESGWQERVVSSAGAIGVMQLLPATADWVSATMLGEGINLWNARSNVRAGVALLRHYLARYGNRPMALAAYYQGQAGTDRYGIYPISRPYVASILLLERMFRG
jgi:N-acetylmuramoyl-L-alanine amidase